MAPSPEVFPGGSWERPWVAGEDGEEMTLDYAAGGSYVTVEGAGAIAIELDGEPAGTVAVANPALYPLVKHSRHEAHRVQLRPTPGLRIWSISFAAGIP